MFYIYGVIKGPIVLIYLTIYKYIYPPEDVCQIQKTLRIWIAFLTETYSKIQLLQYAYVISKHNCVSILIINTMQGGQLYYIRWLLYIMVCASAKLIYCLNTIQFSDQHCVSENDFK